MANDRNQRVKIMVLVLQIYTLLEKSKLTMSKLQDNILHCFEMGLVSFTNVKIQNQQRNLWFLTINKYILAVLMNSQI